MLIKTNYLYTKAIFAPYLTPLKFPNHYTLLSAIIRNASQKKNLNKTTRSPNLTLRFKESYYITFSRVIAYKSY